MEDILEVVRRAQALVVGRRVATLRGAMKGI